MSTSQALRLRALVRACELSGGPSQLAISLGISESRLRFMLDGRATVPEHVFLRVVDILSDRQVPDLLASSRKNNNTASPEA